MGENQGMIWIILGVIVVAAVLMLLGGTMSDAIGSTASEIESQAAAS
ncbi:hypothetical protein R2F61_04675 [Mollicutes bacterium LVI A0078]|nr:hypothetical protein RZE84_04695 [Mollicutes bacterium LVI A0075]WOO91840.1 hypothetical protein R2F61_04675 [Mollicutes bacterium LVI A0078]